MNFFKGLVAARMIDLTPAKTYTKTKKSTKEEND